MSESKHTRVEVIALLRRLAEGLSDDAGAREALDEACSLLKCDGAAPKMLEALQDILRWYRELQRPGDVPDGALLHARLRGAQKLVAKATGGEQ